MGHLQRHRSGRANFGPYSNAKRVRDTLEVLSRVFLVRSCTGSEPGRRSGSPCLDYHIKRCAAPCVGYVSREEYRSGIDGVAEFLRGNYKGIERELEAIPVFYFAIVEPEGFAIDVGRKVKRLDADMCSLDAPLEQRPKVFEAIRVNRATHIRFGVVDKIVSVVCG